jgi:hypothetical protein
LDHKTEGNANIARLSSPKPDLTYAFPIFKDAVDLPGGFVDYDCAKNFSVDYLMQLRQPSTNGLRLKCSLNAGLYKASQRKCKIDELNDYELMCFPWALVEVKKPDVQDKDVEKCYCQAANGSAIALKILGSVFFEAYGSIPDDLPPIIAFTCIGPDLRLWLAYVDRQPELGQKVICPTPNSCVWPRCRLLMQPR